MRIRKSRIGLPVLAGLVAIAVAVAGSATINERSAATHAAGEPNDRASETASAPRVAAVGSDDPAVQRKSRCKDCGVVESVSRIERQRLEDGVCIVSDINVLRGDLEDRSEVSKGMPTLANIVRRAVAGQSLAQIVPTQYRYRMVVRLRDGTRHVFDEATSRTLRSGDFVHVI
jgi:hypothetical protein